MKRRALVQALQQVVGAEGVIAHPAQLLTYETDGLTGYRQPPLAVVLPTTTEQVSGVLRLLSRHGVPYVARGSGTGLSGGALPVVGSVVVSTARMNRIVSVDLDNGRAVVEPGVINRWVTEQVAHAGYYFAPDPSSQQVCSIGGNVAENSGGVHCLKYGVTVNHVLGLEVVLSDGTVVELGSAALDPPGYDLTGVFVGSEGTLGIATRITLRLLRAPETALCQLAAFPTIEAAGAAVSAIVAAGIVPGGIELMDSLAIQATEAATGAGYPLDAGAILLCEVDGPRAEVEEHARRVATICHEQGATEVRAARDAAERALLWKGRKAAFAAMGRISREYYVQDGVIPRTTLPRVLAEIGNLSARYGLRVANVFHAGDGNLHPLILYSDAEGGLARAEALGAAILHLCIAVGGSITGEHGVGHDKKAYLADQFTPDDLDTMQRVRCAFDPAGLANPTKLFPTPRLCAEHGGPYRAHPLEQAGVLERF